MKRCTLCHEEKDLSSFSISEGYYRSRCNECRRKMCQAYRRKTREEIDRDIADGPGIDYHTEAGKAEIERRIEQARQLKIQEEEARHAIYFRRAKPIHRYAQTEQPIPAGVVPATIFGKKYHNPTKERFSTFSE